MIDFPVSAVFSIVLGVPDRTLKFSDGTTMLLE